MMMDPMVARAEMARQHEVVSDGAHTARFLAELVRTHLRACVARLSRGVGERLTGLRRVEALRVLESS